MKYPVVFPSFIAWMLYTYMAVTGDSTENCDEKYSTLSNDCTESCSKLNEGLHRTFSCHHYCVCVTKKGVHRTCPEGMVFNHLIENCDYPQNYQCPERPQVPVNYKCPNPNGRFAYPGCCVLFITCSNGIPYTDICSARTHFSVETDRCEDPQDAGCSDRKTTTTWKPENTTCDLKCPHDGEFAHPKDCSKFCHCVHGIPYEKDCAPGSHFNPELQVCDNPANVDCGYETTEIPIDPTVPTATDSGDHTTEVTPTFKCPRPFGHFPDNNNCNKYFHCSNNKSYHRTCPPGLHYNPLFRTCDRPSTAGCQTSGLSEPIGKCSVEGAERDRNNCSRFYFCEYGQLFLETCPEGSIFIGAPQLSCDYKENPSDFCPMENAFTEKRCPCQNCNIPDTKDCGYYFHCHGGKARHEKCYRGQIFRNDTNQCGVIKGKTCP